MDENGDRCLVCGSGINEEHDGQKHGANPDAERERLAFRERYRQSVATEDLRARLNCWGAYRKDNNNEGIPISFEG